MWAMCLLELGRSGESAARFRKVLQIDPGNITAVEGVGRSVFIKTSYEESIQKFKDMMRADPEDPFPFIAIGTALTRQGKYDQAEEYFRQAVEKDPEESSAFINWGAMLEYADRSDEALEKYGKALELEPDSIPVLVKIGDCHFRQERNIQAKEYYLKALKLKPVWQWDWSNISWAFSNLRCMETEEKDEYWTAQETALYKKELEVNPDNRYVIWHYMNVLDEDDPLKKELFRKILDIDTAAEISLSGNDITIKECLEYIESITYSKVLVPLQNKINLEKKIRFDSLSVSAGEVIEKLKNESSLPFYFIENERARWQTVISWGYPGFLATAKPAPEKEKEFRFGKPFPEIFEETMTFDWHEKPVPEIIDELTRRTRVNFKFLERDPENREGLLKSPVTLKAADMKISSVFRWVCRLLDRSCLYLGENTVYILPECNAWTGYKEEFYIEQEGLNHILTAQVDSDEGTVGIKDQNFNEILEYPKDDIRYWDNCVFLRIEDKWYEINTGYCAVGTRADIVFASRKGEDIVSVMRVGQGQEQSLVLSAYIKGTSSIQEIKGVTLPADTFREGNFAFDWEERILYVIDGAAVASRKSVLTSKAPEDGVDVQVFKLTVFPEGMNRGLEKWMKVKIKPELEGIDIRNNTLQVVDDVFVWHSSPGMLPEDRYRRIDLKTKKVKHLAGGGIFDGVLTTVGEKYGLYGADGIAAFRTGEKDHERFIVESLPYGCLETRFAGDHFEAALQGAKKGLDVKTIPGELEPDKEYQYPKELLPQEKEMKSEYRDDDTWFRTLTFTEEDLDRYIEWMEENGFEMAFTPMVAVIETDQ